MGAKPQLAVSSYEFKGTPLVEMLEFVARLDVRLVELWPFSVDGEDLPAARQALAARNMEVSCVSAMSTHRLNQEATDLAQQAILRAITLAREFGAPLVTTYMGASPDRDLSTMLQRYVQDLEPCLEEATRHGITILLENMFDHRNEDPAGTKPSRTAAGTLAVAEAVASPHFGVTYDPCNFHIAAIEPYPYAYELLRPFIRNVHLKDATLYAETLHGDPHPYAHWLDSMTGRWLSRPVGQGAVNFYALFERLSQDGFSGPLTLDIMTRPHEREAAYRDGVAYVRRWLDV